MILDATTKSLEIVLAGAVTTNQLVVVSSWADITTTTFTPGETDVLTNGTTQVTIVAAPGASTQRQVKEILIYNNDTVNATIRVRYNNNTTIRQLINATIGTGECLVYREGSGWMTLDINGKIKYGMGASEVINLIYPVGSIYISVVSTNPGTLFGVGTWGAFGTGRTLVGLDAGQTEFDVVEETGGAKTHALSEAELAVHTHVQNAHDHVPYGAGATGGALNMPVYTGAVLTPQELSTETIATTVATNQNTGSGTAHNNLQPYIVVYMWKRTA